VLKSLVFLPAALLLAVLACYDVTVLLLFIAQLSLPPWTYDSHMQRVPSVGLGTKPGVSNQHYTTTLVSTSYGLGLYLLVGFEELD